MRRIILFLLAVTAVAGCEDSPTVLVLDCVRPVYGYDAKTGALTVVDSIYTCKHS